MRRRHTGGRRLKVLDPEQPATNENYDVSNDKRENQIEAEPVRRKPSSSEEHHDVGDEEVQVKSKSLGQDAEALLPGAELVRSNFQVFNSRH